MLLLRSALALLASSALMACSTPAAPAAKERPARVAGAAALSTEEAPGPSAGEEAWAYDPSTGRDPFETYFDDLAPSTPEGSLTELQRLELDELELVAVVSGTATPLAMVQDDQGRGHSLRVGTLVGVGGQVTRIEPGRVVVRERFREPTGRVVPVDSVLELERPEAELARR